MTFLEYPSQLYTYLLDIVFNEDASYKELYTVAAALGVFWAIFIEVTKHIVGYFSYDKPWLRQSFDREYNRLPDEGRQGLSKEEFIEKGMKEWPWNVAVALQHVFGSLVCLPFLVSLLHNTSFLYI